MIALEIGEIFGAVLHGFRNFCHVIRQGPRPALRCR